MTHVMRAGDLIGLPVVSIASGEDVAEVRDVVYDSTHHRILGFTLNKRGAMSGRLKEALAAESVAAIGAAAVMVSDESAITDSGSGPEALHGSGAATSVIGNRVLSADGDNLGAVVGVIVTTGAAPAAVGYEIASESRADNAFVPISEQMALSEDNLLLPAEATEFVRNDLAGFGAAVESYRSSALSGGDR